MSIVSNVEVVFIGTKYTTKSLQELCRILRMHVLSFKCFFMSTLLRYDLHILKYTHFKGIAQ